MRVVCSELLRLASEERHAIRLKRGTDDAVKLALSQVREDLSRLEDSINDDIPF